MSPGDKSEGASELHRMGYELELYPSTAYLSPLRDAREEESASYLGRSPASAERSHVRSRRASFIRDVYKRQRQGIILVFMAGGHASISLLLIAHGSHEVELGTVSYTHLDVYKRKAVFQQRQKARSVLGKPVKEALGLSGKALRTD